MLRLRRYLPIALILVVVAPVRVAANDEAEVALQFALARSLSEEGSVAEALVAWQQLVTLAPEEPYLRIEYGRFLARVSRFDQAVDQVANALDLAPENPDVLRGYADVVLAASRSDPQLLDLARGTLEELIALEPEDVDSLFDLGRTYHELGRFAEAAVWLGRAAERQPRNRTLQSYLVDSLLQSQQNDVAAVALREYLQYDASFLRGRLQLAMLESERGDHLASAAVLRSAPEGQLDDRELLWQLAGQLYRLGDLEEGVETIDGLLSVEPTAFRERMLKGMMLSASGHDDAALEVYAGLRLERPLNLDIVSELVKLYERQGEPQRAEALLREVDRDLAAAGADRRQVQVRFELMNHLWRTEAWDRLAREARPLVADVNSALHAQGVFYLADALHGDGKSRQALELLEGFSDGSVSTARRLAKRAEILADMGRDDETEAVLQELEGAADLSSLLSAAEVYHRQERYARAEAVLDKALEFDSGSSQVLYWLGAAQERSGDLAEATKTFRTLLAQNPRHAPTLNYLGYMFAEQGRHLDEALDMVMGAVAQEPDNGAYVDSLGWAHFQLGDYGRARDLLERAARLVPDDAVISEHLGDVYARLGDSNRARKSYQRAIRLDGENREAVRRKLDRLVVSR